MTGSGARRRIFGAAIVASLAAMADPAAAQLAEHLGPVVAHGEASGGYVGRLRLEPDHAPAGGVVTITGSGLPPNGTFDLVWRTVTGAWKVENGEYHGRAYTPVGYRIAAVQSDATGRFETRFTTPEDFGYLHDIVVQQGGRLLTQAGFNLDQTMTISPDHGPLGTPITVDIKGIGWRELENSWDLVYDNGFTGWTSAVATHGSAHFTIPATGAPGVHVLKLIHGEFTFPYMNPQQNPRPDRPRFASRFTLTPGEPVLPKAAAEQTPVAVRGLAPAGALDVTPALGPIGTPVKVEAKGYTPKKTYALTFATMTGNRVGGGGFEEAARTVASATAAADGRLQFAFNAPDDLGGAHRLSVEGDDPDKSGVFTIVTSASPLSLREGPAGEPFSIHLKGVGWTETANIYTIVYDNAYVGYACGFNSQGDVEIFMTASGAPGWHYIDLYPAIYKGQEIRPNNFRIPQLTFAQDHPGEDLPAFHFAFRVGELTEAQR